MRKWIKINDWALKIKVFLKCDKCNAVVEKEYQNLNEGFVKFLELVEGWRFDTYEGEVFCPNCFKNEITKTQNGGKNV